MSIVRIRTNQMDQIDESIYASKVHPIFLGPWKRSNWLANFLVFFYVQQWLTLSFSVQACDVAQSIKRYRVHYESFCCFSYYNNSFPCLMGDAGLAMIVTVCWCIQCSRLSTKTCHFRYSRISVSPSYFINVDYLIDDWCIIK